jgi:hypothetical protein
VCLLRSAYGFSNDRRDNLDSRRGQYTPSYVSGALDTLASVLASVSATATARAAPVYWSVGNTGSVTTNSYLDRLGDISATATSVSPVVVPCLIYKEPETNERKAASLRDLRRSVPCCVGTAATITALVA